MTFLTLLASSIIPLALFVLPGVALLPRRRFTLPLFIRVLLLSFSAWILVSFLVTLVQLPAVASVLCIAALTIAFWLLRQSGKPIKHLPGRGKGLFLLTVAAAAYLLFGYFFWQNHQALPTGDSQKAIYWAQQILTTNRLPHYQQSTSHLNRDPVDFYTPGLHTLVASTSIFSSSSLETTIGFLAVACSVAVAVVAAGLAYVVSPRFRTGAAMLAFFLVLSNGRFLRYLREPGYHLQNVIGELLLFGLLFLGVSALKRWRWADAGLGMMLALALLLTHQFSAFLAAFILAPVVLLLLAQKVSAPAFWQSISRLKLLGLAIIVILAAIASFSLGLHHKIPHIFTTTPHLAHLIVPYYEYPRTLGYLLTYGGVVGFIVLLIGLSSGGKMSTRTNIWPKVALAAGGLMILLLSRGPKIGIDIPPVRALFYVIVPLSSAFAVFVCAYWKKLSRLSIWLPLVLILATLIAGLSSLSAALSTNHQVRTNSTYTPGQQGLVHFLREQPGSGVLIDDYNRRSASWLILSGHPMYTRIAADLRTQMLESEQSALRQQLYLNQLDYEKIFSLGSRPDILPLLQKHNITWVSGISGSSLSAFSQNPGLQPQTSTDDITLFSARPEVQFTFPAEIHDWLLRPSTLVNDLGDDEDTFEHLPASIRATRLSSSRQSGDTTFRSTTAPVIPLTFNVGDFVDVLWRKQYTNYPDSSLAFYWQLESPATTLSLRTEAGYTIKAASGTVVTLPASAVPLQEKGMITLYIDNPTEQEVAIDLIALGLSQVP